jgi:DNA-binding XRE family transcriptional regulator
MNLNKLKAKIVENGTNVEAVADYIGIDRVTYNRLENEKYSVKLDYAIKIAEFYKVSLDYIAGITDKR